MSNYKDSLAYFKQVLAKFSSTLGLDLCIAGGAIRDIHHDRVPKDIDIEVLNFGDSRYSLGNDDLTLLCDELENIGACHVELYSNYNGEAAANLDFLIKFKWQGTDFDLILQTSRPTTPKEAVANYDMSLNQVFFYGGEFDVSALERTFTTGTIEPTGKMITLNRLSKMIKKYPEYDYTRMVKYIIPHEPDEAQKPIL
mgnify:CR=1 FL=1